MFKVSRPNKSSTSSLEYEASRHKEIIEVVLGANVIGDRSSVLTEGF